MKKNFYQILQVDSYADIEIIEVAYKRLARKYHPDINNSPNATTQMQEINEAYETLKDKFKRNQYDAKFLPNLKQSKNTKSESKNTREKRETEESIKKTQTSSKPNNYYKSAKVEQEQSVKSDKIRYEEWAKKSRNTATPQYNQPHSTENPNLYYKNNHNPKKSQQKSPRQKNLDSVQGTAISIIIFNILPCFYLVYAFDKQMTVINNSSDNKILEGAWLNIFVICLSAIMSIISIYGGFRMYKLKNYRLSVFSTIALFFTSAVCCVLSYIFAIAGLLILFDPEAKALFDEPNKK